MITSTGNKKVKEIIQLQKKASLRKARGVYVTEGRNMFSEAEPARIEQVYVAERFLQSFANRRLLADKLGMVYREGEDLPALLNRCSIGEAVSDSVMAAMSDTMTPQGVLCVMRQPQYSLEDMLKGPAPRLVFLEDLRDPGNLGTIMRTAEGAGMAGILLSRGCVDMYNPKTIRSTMGSLYRVPFLYLDDPKETLRKLKERNLPVYGAALDQSVSYETLSYRNGCVFLIGNEARGLSKELLEMADCGVRIPMEGKVESLNAAVAAAVLMYESYRQIVSEN